MPPIYVQYGCGFSVGADWLNFDSSPTLRAERLPIVGSWLAAMAGKSRRFPPQVRYGDIRRGLPLPPGSARAVYASHVLEHLSREDFARALANTFSILEPGGTFRLVVPDLQERANRYVKDVATGDAEANTKFMRACHLGMETRPRTLIGALGLLLGGSSHLWMWDEPSMIAALRKAGFIDVERCAFNDSADPMFSQVEHPTRFHDEALDVRELAVSARKPASASVATPAR